jgi:hypothetical protein
VQTPVALSKNILSLRGLTHTVVPCLLVLVGLASVIPHLSDEVWQDEAWTLLNFSKHGFLYPFFDYHLPNNHVLLSAVLSLWWQPGDSILHLRLLPFICLALTLPAIYFAARNLFGPEAGLFTLAMFVSSDVTETFALQLRGYGFSWLPFCVLLLAIPRYARGGGFLAGTSCVLAMAVSVAILPTNLVFNLALTLWGGVILILHRSQGNALRWERVFVLLLGSLLGLAAYAITWEQLVYFAQVKLSDWTVPGLVSHWLWATQSGFLWLMPVILIGLVAMIRHAASLSDVEQNQTLTGVFLPMVVIGIVLLWLAVATSVPFPRTLAAALPLWYVSMGILCAAGWQILVSVTRPHHGQWALLLVIFFCPVYAAHTQACSGTGAASNYSADLCTQYFQQDYHPTKTMALLRELVKNNPLPVVTDFEGRYALGFIAVNDKQTTVSPMLYLNWPEHVKTAEILYAPLVVTRDEIELDRILKAIDLSHVSYTKLASTGFFKIYGPEPP